MTAKSFIKLVFFFFIIERLIQFASRLPLIEQIYRTLQMSSFDAYVSPALRFVLFGPLVDIVVIVVLIIVVRNERILNKLSGWLAK